jgi:hypothetical protein
MTMTLAHPAAEDLGRFVEGTLDDAGRAAVVAHIVDCDECRIVVVDATAFGEEAAAATRGTGGRWWLAKAAAIAIVAGSMFTWYTLRDPLTPVIEASAHLSSRPVQARLSRFPYLELKRTRGGAGEKELAGFPMYEEIAEVLERSGSDPKTLHAKGVVHLLAATSHSDEEKDAAVLISEDRKEAVENLQLAANRAPNNARYLSDLASALIEKGDPANLARAVAACDRAIRIDPRSAEALFNKAVALQGLNRTQDAITAFKQYLAVDSSSPWAAEAKANIEHLKESLPPS